MASDIETPGGRDERQLVADLRAGKEDAFAALIERYYAPMLRVARNYVATAEAAEDVVQDTWMGVIAGIDRFEGRSSLKTWLFRILVNRAQTRGEREGRTRPFSSIVGETGSAEASVPAERFFETGRWAGFWASPLHGAERPEDQLLAAEARAMIEAAIDELPASQRLVITLRDVQGFSAEEVCELLSISSANQRVLLHRARSHARQALDAFFERHQEAVA